MQSTRHRWVRRVTALPVALVMWFASLSPIAAQWLTSSASAACCRSKCCCHRAKTKPGEVGISGRTCGPGCAAAPFAAAAHVVIVAPALAAAPARIAATLVTPSAPFPSRASTPQLYQRPPPHAF